MILTHGANSLNRGGGNTVKIGGKAYKTVTIGNQVWLAENLDYKFAGCDIGPTGSPDTPAAWYYNNNEADYGIDGTYKCSLLYNGYAVDYLNNHLDELGIPSGWHVPTDDEWTALADAVGGASTAGTKLKALDNSVTSGFPSGWNGTDDYGFGVLPGGYFGGSFESLNVIGFFYTSTHTGSFMFARTFESSAPMHQAPSALNYAYSLRLVKDAT